MGEREQAEEDPEVQQELAVERGAVGGGVHGQVPAEQAERGRYREKSHRERILRSRAERAGPEPLAAVGYRLYGGAAGS